MRENKFLEEKFLELNKIKSMMITYPEDYQEDLKETFEKVCLQIESYLNEVNFSNFNRMNDFVNIKRDSLERYNGQEGMPAYIAVNGIVYDISESDEWKHGRYLGVKAGVDLSEDLSNESGEILRMLARFRVVGVIKEEVVQYNVTDKKHKKRDKKKDKKK